MPDQNIAIVNRWFDEIWTQKKIENLGELLSEDSLAHGLVDVPGLTPRGHDGFKELFYAFTNAFPDLKITIQDIINENDRVAVRCIIKGTHFGDGLGIAPTRKTIEFTGLCIMRIADGKIIEVWNQFDFMAMYQQLGALSIAMG